MYMSSNMKKILGVIIAVVVIVCTYFYITTFGVPFKKSSVAKDIQKHLEDKYEQDIERVGSVYNFIDKHYGGVYELNNIEFYAEKRDDEEPQYIDTYANEIWTEQLREDFLDRYTEVFSNADHIYTHYTFEADLEIDPLDIPRYDEVDPMLTIDFHIDEPFEDIDEQWDAIGKLVTDVQEKSSHVDSNFIFVDEDQETHLSCPDYATNEITTKDDAQKLCEQTIEED